MSIANTRWFMVFRITRILTGTLCYHNAVSECEMVATCSNNHCPVQRETAPTYKHGVRYSSVNAAILYGLEESKIESHCQRGTLRLSGPDLRHNLPSVKWALGHSEGKAAGARYWPPTASRAEIKKGLELYLLLPVLYILVRGDLYL
jgi:hypothetical protein